MDNTTELWMTKYIVIGEFFSSGGATLYKNPSDQTVMHQKNKRAFAYDFLHHVEKKAFSQSDETGSELTPK